MFFKEASSCAVIQCNVVVALHAFKQYQNFCCCNVLPNSNDYKVTLYFLIITFLVSAMKGG